MWPDDNDLVVKRTVGFHNLFPKEADGSLENDILGGFLDNGQYGWIAKRALLQVVSIESGAKMATFDFDVLPRAKNAEITCVEQIHIENVSACLLAVGLQFPEAGGILCVLSVPGSRILHVIDIYEKVTSCTFISTELCSRGVLKTWDSCLAIGTEQGKIFLYELNLQLCKNVLMGSSLCVDTTDVVPGHITYANVPAKEIEHQRRQAKEQCLNFGVQLEVVGPVLSILAIPASLTLATGLADGRLILYDLDDLQVFHIAFPPCPNAPLIQFCVQEPTDDPRANLYVWSLHASEEGAVAVMHTLIFESKVVEDNVCFYDTFNSCHVRLTIPMYDPGSLPLTLQSISKVTNQGDEIVKLCVIAWMAHNKMTHTIIFDLNQWYKAQMPSICNWRHFPNYIAAFEANNRSALGVCLSEESLVPFNSIQRPEEHFHPNSLSFDIQVLTEVDCVRSHWAGVQQKVLAALTKNGPYAILDPEDYFEETMAAVLVPQFYDYGVTKYSTIDEKREFLLSVALEYNCVGVLKQCALAWADGSHLGRVRDADTPGVSLSTLTEWIWQRAKLLKETSNELCVPLFDFSGQPIDFVIQKALSHCTRQLKILSELFAMIVTRCRKYIPEPIVGVLDDQAHSIRMASDYQDVLQWLLNVGMLPEGVWQHDADHTSGRVASYRRHLSSSMVEEEFISVPFPYPLISGHYKTQRAKLSCGDRRRREQAAGEMRPGLFIDEFIERELNAKELRHLWRSNGGSADYPPSSLQTMLRTLLIADITAEQKYILFVYLFLDIDSVMSDGRYSLIVQNLVKFPAVFKMNPGTIKRTQGFWYFDHGHLETAVEELISPLAHDHTPLSVWQRELLIVTLLKYDAPHLALRVLRSPGLQISPNLELDTLLANKLVSEAFKFQRSKNDKSLLVKFIDSTMKSSMSRDILLDFALTDEEEAVFEDFLNNSNLPMAENMHLVYLLQRAKFNQAVTLVDSLGKRPSGRMAHMYNLDIPKEVLSIYHSNLEPTTRHLTYLTYQNPEKFCQRKRTAEPKPLSTRLFGAEADRTNVFQKLILSVKEAGDEVTVKGKAGDFDDPFIRRPGLGIFASNFQARTHSNQHVVYPMVIQQKAQKRKINQDALLEAATVQGPDVPDAASKEVFNFNELQGPTKRRRVVGDPQKSLKDINPKILTVFQERKPTFNFTQQPALQLPISASQMLEESPEKPDRPETALSTPVVVRRQPSARQLSPASTISRCTPQSILKNYSRRQISVSPVSSRVSTVDVDEKAIRFNLPAANVTTSSAIDTTLENSSGLFNEFNEYLEDKTIDDSVEPEIEKAEASHEASAISVDVYFSPETSTREEEAYQTLLTHGLLSGSFSRPPIHEEGKAVASTSQSVFQRSFRDAVEKPAEPDVVEMEDETPVKDSQNVFERSFSRKDDEMAEKTTKVEVVETPCIKKVAYVCGPDVEVQTAEATVEETVEKTEYTTVETSTTQVTTLTVQRQRMPEATPVERIIPIEMADDSSDSAGKNLFQFDKSVKKVEPPKVTVTVTTVESSSSSESDSSPLPSPIKKVASVLQDDTVVEDKRYSRLWKEGSMETTNLSVNDTSVFEPHTVFNADDTEEAQKSSSSADSTSGSTSLSEEELGEEFDTDDDDIVKYYDNKPVPVGANALNASDDEDDESDEDIVKYYDNAEDSEPEPPFEESDISNDEEPPNRFQGTHKSEVIDILDSSEEDEQNFEELKTIGQAVRSEEVPQLVVNPLALAKSTTKLEEAPPEDEGQISSMLYDDIERDSEVVGDMDDTNALNRAVLVDTSVQSLYVSMEEDELEVEAKLPVETLSAEKEAVEITIPEPTPSAVMDKELLKESCGARTEEELVVEDVDPVQSEADEEIQKSSNARHEPSAREEEGVVLEDVEPAQSEEIEAGADEEGLKKLHNEIIGPSAEEETIVKDVETVQTTSTASTAALTEEILTKPEIVKTVQSDATEVLDKPMTPVSTSSAVVDNKDVESVGSKANDNLEPVLSTIVDEKVAEKDINAVQNEASEKSTSSTGMDEISTKSCVAEYGPSAEEEVAVKNVEPVQSGAVEKPMTPEPTSSAAVVEEIPKKSRNDRRRSKSGSPPPHRNLRSASIPPGADDGPATPDQSKKARVRSKSIDHPTALDSPSVRRILRGKSVPKQIAEPEHSTPKKRNLRSMSADVTEHSGSQLAVKPTLDVIVENVDQPLTPKRSHRKSSVDTPELVSTPRRVTRRSSTNTPVQDLLDSSVDMTTPRKRGRPRKSSVDDDARSEKSTTGSLKGKMSAIRSPEISAIPEESVVESLEVTPPHGVAMDQESRRLTRSQMQVLNKSAEVTRRTAESKVRTMRKRSSSQLQEDDGNLSDSSVASNVTNVSQSPSGISTRSRSRRSARPGLADDTDSVASSTRSKTRGSPATPVKNLTVIQEQSEDDSSVASLVIDEDPPQSKRPKRVQH